MYRTYLAVMDVLYGNHPRRFYLPGKLGVQ